MADGENRSSVLSCGELHRRALSIGKELGARFAPGERILLVLPPGPDFLTSFLGTIYAGLVAVPLPVPRFPLQNERLAAVSANARPTAAIASDELDLRDLGDLARLDPADICMEHHGWLPRWSSANDIALLQYTSGSTGIPRGVTVSHRNLLSNSELLRQRFGYDRNSIAVTWLPPSHDMGLIEALLQPLLHGGQTIAMPPLAFLRRPERWLRAISRFRASHAGAPDFAYAQCVERITPALRRDLDLSSWQIAYVAAEPIRSETLIRFDQTFAPHGFRRDAFHTSYGLAENTLLVSDGPAEQLELCADALQRGCAVRADSTTERRRVLVGCGVPDGNSKIRIIDPETKHVLPECRVGEVCISGPSVAAGYWNLPDETQSTFNAVLPAEGQEEGRAFLRTGDLGFMMQGRLCITGRLKDLIILNGRNIYPQDVERSVAAAHPAIRRSPAAFSTFGVDGETSDRLVVVCEIRPDEGSASEAIVRAVRSAVATSIEAEISIVVLAPPGTVRYTTSGKIMRQDCRSRFFLGQLAPFYVSEIGASTETWVDAATDSVRAFLRRRLSITNVDGESRLAEFGIDSLAATELAHLLETHYRIRLAAVELLQSTVGQLDKLIAEARPSVPQDPIEPADHGAALVRGQVALWFLHRLWTGLDPFHLNLTARLPGNTDVKRLVAAFDRLVDRHGILRSIFPERVGADQPEEAISATRPRLVVRDHASVDDQLLKTLADEPFDLQKLPPAGLPARQGRRPCPVDLRSPYCCRLLVAPHPAARSGGVLPR